MTERRIRKVDYVGIAVHDMTEAVQLFQDALGSPSSTAGTTTQLASARHTSRFRASRSNSCSRFAHAHCWPRPCAERGPGSRHLTFTVDDVL